MGGVHYIVHYAWFPEVNAAGSTPLPSPFLSWEKGGKRASMLAALTSGDHAYSVYYNALQLPFADHPASSFNWLVLSTHLDYLAVHLISVHPSLTYLSTHTRDFFVLCKSFHSGKFHQLQQVPGPQSSPTSPLCILHLLFQTIPEFSQRFQNWSNLGCLHIQHS